MCGTDAGLKRGWWHRDCAARWNLAAAPQVQRHELILNTGSVCWNCGEKKCSPELEHIRPLWSLRGDETNELKWWLPFNLQLLCRPCHLAKSKREAAERAQLRRAA